MRLLLITVVIFAIGLGTGYHFGLDHGFERAVSEFDAHAMERTSMETPHVLVESVDKETTPPSPAEAMVGVWQSVQDSKFTREFQEDGTVIDRYEGDDSATVEGSWYLFMYPTDERVPFTIQPGVQYLRITMPEEVLYFSVTKVDAADLELVYLGVGDTLQFIRLQ